MEAEFVNEYIEQLNKKLHDLISQNVLAETRIAHLSKQLAQVSEELQRLRDAPAPTAPTKKPAAKEDF